MLYFIISDCVVRYFIVSKCIALCYCIVLHCSVLYCIVVYCFILQCIYSNTYNLYGTLPISVDKSSSELITTGCAMMRLTLGLLVGSRCSKLSISRFNS